MDYEFRLATIDECDELSKIKREVWETTYRGIYPDSKLDNYDYNAQTNKFKQIVNHEDVYLYVIVIKDKIVGYFDYGKPVFRPYKDYEQEIGLLYLLKEYQSQGIGKKVFFFASNKIKEKGYNKFFISCNKYNYNAQIFYEKMGGKVIEIDKDNNDGSIPQIRYHYDVIKKIK